MDGNSDSIVQSSPDIVVGVVSCCSSTKRCSGQHIRVNIDILVTRIGSSEIITGMGKTILAVSGTPHDEGA